jgi:glucose/mannose-6-phosphate isomerase
MLQNQKNKKYEAVFDTVDQIPRQFLSALGQKTDFPSDYRGVKNVVVCGMGGSALGSHILMAQNTCSVPFSFYNGYELPSFVGRDTLFIASSYSGTTEEVLSSLGKAEKAGAKIAGMAAGGELLEILKKKNLPFIKFDEKLNPSGQPRYGVGYALGALYNILINLGLAKTLFAEIKSVAEKIKKYSASEAAKLAKELKDCAPVFVAGEFLEGNAHLLANQINETCKVYSEWHPIPELNHHLMEGLARPADMKKYLKFIFIESDLYNKRIAARFEITKKVIAKNKVKYAGFKVAGKTKLEQVLNCAVLGSAAGVIVAEAYGEDPADIPWVKFFKNELSRLSSR